MRGACTRRRLPNGRRDHRRLDRRGRRRLSDRCDRCRGRDRVNRRDRVGSAARQGRRARPIGRGRLARGALVGGHRVDCRQLGRRRVWNGRRRVGWCGLGHRRAGRGGIGRRRIARRFWSRGFSVRPGQCWRRHGAGRRFCGPLRRCGGRRARGGSPVRGTQMGAGRAALAGCGSGDGDRQGHRRSAGHTRRARGHPPHPASQVSRLPDPIRFHHLRITPFLDGLTRLFAQRIHPLPCAGHSRPDRQSVARVAAFAAGSGGGSSSLGQSRSSLPDDRRPIFADEFRCIWAPLEQCAGRPPQVRDAGRLTYTVVIQQLSHRASRPSP